MDRSYEHGYVETLVVIKRSVERTEGRKSFLHMMFTTAMEGGIGYWSVAKEYSWSKAGAGAVIGLNSDIEDLDGFYAIIESNEDEWGMPAAFIAETGQIHDITETQSLRIDISIMERGVNLLVNKVVEATKTEDPDAGFSRKYLRQFVIQWLTDAEDGDSDSDVADLVVQLGLFGEVVYA